MPLYSAVLSCGSLATSHKPTSETERKKRHWTRKIMKTASEARWQHSPRRQPPPVSNTEEARRSCETHRLQTRYGESFQRLPSSPSRRCLGQYKSYYNVSDTWSLGAVWPRPGPGPSVSPYLPPPSSSLSRKLGQNGETQGETVPSLLLASSHCQKLFE